MWTKLLLWIDRLLDHRWMWLCQYAWDRQLDATADEWAVVVTDEWLRYLDED